MSDIVVAIHKLAGGDTLWVRREDVSDIATAGYVFEVAGYDDEYARVEIGGHADDPELNKRIDGESDEEGVEP